MSLYNAEISAGSLMPTESRRIAELLLTNPTEEQWDAALKDENMLQKKPSTARRQARLIRNRLDTLDAEGLAMVVEGDSELRGQTLLASLRGRAWFVRSSLARMLYVSLHLMHHRALLSWIRTASLALARTLIRRNTAQIKLH
jgi:hypothetical protein